MNIQPIKIKLLDERAVIPTMGTEFSAGADLYALLSEAVELMKAHSTKIVHTGISLEIPKGYVGLVCARSGIANKKGLAPSNKIGIIDSDYRGEIMISLHNHSDEDVFIEDGERIAQLVIVPYLTPDFQICANLDKTERGSGGFGSTGEK